MVEPRTKGWLQRCVRSVMRITFATASKIAKVCEIAHTCDIMAWETVVQSGQHAESAWVLVAGRVQRVVIDEETRRNDDHSKHRP